jgi:hypothetical protein
MLRDAVAEHTGYSKLEMHSIAKTKIVPLMLDDESNFNLDKFTIEEIAEKPSLTMLSDDGLQIFVDAFKSFCLDNFKFSL